MSPSPTNQKIRTHLFVAESAQITGGKLYVLGGAICASAVPQPGVAVMLALAGTIEVPWEQNHRQHEMKIEAFYADGNPYMVPGLQGPVPLSITANFTAALAPQMARGSSSGGPFAMQFALPAFQPGTMSFRISVDGEETQTLPFAITIGGASAPPG
jgi:hypothetical protein